MPSVFDYDRVLRMARDTWGNNELRFLGHVVSGAFSLNDTVFVPVLGGDPIQTNILRFTENFTDDWCGMPFYDTVRPNSVTKPFCVCVNGTAFINKLIVNPSQLVAK